MLLDFKIDYRLDCRNFDFLASVYNRITPWPLYTTV